jgi:hypothetical protein
MSGLKFNAATPLYTSDAKACKAAPSPKAWLCTRSSEATTPAS